MNRTTYRFGRALTALAAGLTLLALAAPAAATTDADMAKAIREEAVKFNEELAKWGADLAKKGEDARTGELTARSSSCATQPSMQPFLAFGDTADYTLVPGGTFETGTSGWQLENQARVVNANSSFYVSARTDARSLQLPKGSRVTTRPLCVTAAHPTVRLFLSAKGSSRARLLMEVLYEDLGGSVKVLPIAYLRPSFGWQPTVVVPLQVNLRATLSRSGTAAVALRLTAMEADATWSLDDLYVDPFKAR